MKKYIITAILCVITASPLLTSCDLDEFPAGSITEEQTWVEMKDAENFQRGLLSSMRSISGGEFAYLTDIQSDLFNMLNGATNYNAEHAWTFTNVLFAGDNLYIGYYSAIYDANLVLGNIAKITPSNAEETGKLNAIKGSAYFLRAYAHFNLILRYSKDYEPATAKNELGIVLISANDIEAKPARASLEDSYRFVCADLDSARKYLADEQYLFEINKDVDPVHIFGIDALSALTARVYMYMHRYQEAIDAAEEVMWNYPLISSRSEFAEMWKNDAGSEIIFQPFMEKENERTNPYSAFISYNTTFRAFRPIVLPTRGLYAMYDNQDYRKDVYFRTVELATNEGGIETGLMLNKFPGNPALAKNQLSDFYNMAKVFRSAELFLIAAECAWQLGEHGLARDYLNELRINRGLSETEKSGSNLFKEIQTEWTREMVGEGFRLDCLKRWHEGFTRLTAQNFTSDMLFNQPGYRDLTVDAANIRFVWEIPNNDLQANPNIIRNWPTNN